MKSYETRRVTPDNIVTLADNEVFVFGSNRQGRHRKGAALMALEHFGAVLGIGEGLIGHSYALPTVRTVEYGKRDVLTLDEIKAHVDWFIKNTKIYPELKFLVTEVGCGLAGYTPEKIAPMFSDCVDLENVYLPKRFLEVIDAIKKK